MTSRRRRRRAVRVALLAGVTGAIVASVLAIRGGPGGTGAVAAAGVATDAGSLSGAGVARPAATVPGQIGTLVGDGAWCWFQDPRAVHLVGRHDRTYVGYVTSGGSVEVVSQDSRTGALTHTVLHVGLQKDDHAAPALEVLPTKQIAVFYSKHTGRDMYYRISRRPEDVSSFGVERRVGVNTAGSAGYTYANPIYLSAEKRTYLFFRAANSKPAVTWSDDGLRTWARPETLATGGSVRPYAKFATNGVDKIVMTFDNGHPRNAPSNSVYALSYRAGILSTMDGTPVASMGGRRSQQLVPDPPVRVQSIQPVYDGHGADGRAWVQDIALDPHGNPVILFGSYPGKHGLVHHYHYARWTGNSWLQTDFTQAGGTIDASGDEPDYSGGMSLDPNDVSTVYASREIGHQWELQRWHTKDGGKTFGVPVDITMDSSVKNVRPVVPHGPPGDIKVLWMAGTYGNWKGQYDTQLRELASGPLPVSLRAEVTNPHLVAGHSTFVAARAVSGFGGRPRPGVQIELWGHSPGRRDSYISTATTDGNGMVRFSVTPAHTMSYDIRTYGGTARSPSTAVTLVSATGARIGVSHGSVKRGRSIVVSIRLLTRGAHRAVGGARVQLWQKARGGGKWQFRGTVRTNLAGLAQSRVRPDKTVIYQARYPGSARYAPTISGTAQVQVRR